jgi:hypothetical protein
MEIKKSKVKAMSGKIPFSQMASFNYVILWPMRLASSLEFLLY